MLPDMLSHLHLVVVAMILLCLVATKVYLVIEHKGLVRILLLLLLLHGLMLACHGCMAELWLEYIVHLLLIRCTDVGYPLIIVIQETVVAHLYLHFYKLCAL